MHAKSAAGRHHHTNPKSISALLAKVPPGNSGEHFLSDFCPDLGGFLVLQQGAKKPKLTPR